MRENPKELWYEMRVLFRFTFGQRFEIEEKVFFSLAI